MADEQAIKLYAPKTTIEDNDDIPLEDNAGGGWRAKGSAFVKKLSIGWFNVGSVVRAFKDSYFGYSAGYRALVIGAVAGSNDTVCIGYDPVANVNDGFYGNGLEIFFRNGATFCTPNSADNDFHRFLLTMKDAKVGIGTNNPQAPFDVSVNAQFGGLSKIKTYSDSNYSGLFNGASLYANEGICFGGAVTYIIANGANRCIISSSSLTPGSDNTMSLGAGGLRYSVVYAASGVINTSDERDKTWRGNLNENELKAANLIIKELGFFQWKEAIEIKGSEARLHFGVKAQKVFSIMENCNLNWREYAWCCYDEWPEEKQQAFIDVEKQIQKEREFYNEKTDKIEIEYYTETIKVSEPTEEFVVLREAGNRYGVRYDQLTFLLT